MVAKYPYVRVSYEYIGAFFPGTEQIELVLEPSDRADAVAEGSNIGG